MKYEFTPEFAAQLDASDPLKSYRERFLFPTFTSNPVRYFTGNSLGLQPKTTQDYVLNERNGKLVPEKVGLKAIQREGLDYEFTVVFDLNMKNNAEKSVFCVFNDPI